MKVWPSFLAVSVITGAAALGTLGLSACSHPVPATQIVQAQQPEDSPSSPASPATLALSAIWANDGGDKVTQDELRASEGGQSSVKNSVWDGTGVHLFGAKNEVVAFDLILEAATKPAMGVIVTFDELKGPQGFTLSSGHAHGDGVFDWNDRNIELFQTRYLQIKGLSRLSYEVYDERHIPRRLRRPYSGAGFGKGGWNDRPDHDKFYPDIAVPLELSENHVQVAAHSNQGIWVDVYIPKDAPAGRYEGTVTVSQGANGESSAARIPVALEVKNFALPDVPTAKTMVYLGYSALGERYVGDKYPASGSPGDRKLDLVRDRHFQLAHRHKIAVVDANEGSGVAPPDRPRPEWVPRLNGSLFTPEKGYDGPGVGVGNGVYSIGSYGSWGWKNEGEPGMWSHTDAWARWFKAHAPDTDAFLYLIDESPDFAQTQQWAQWMAENPGPGKDIKSFATMNLPSAVAKVPALSIAASWFTVGPTQLWADAYSQAKASSPPKEVFMYNGKRPSNGSFATEDDGVALRELAWTQYKKGIDRWFFWESTYYNDTQGGRGETNVFENAQTFGSNGSRDPVLGEVGGLHSNGDGVLFYPGTDKLFPDDSYGVDGPMASLRMKQWRRGIQDVDYLALANAVDPVATRAIVNRMVPKALWDYGISDAKDPTWVRSDVSWSTNPDDWERARRELAAIIEKGESGAAAAERSPQSTAKTSVRPQGRSRAQRPLRKKTR